MLACAPASASGRQRFLAEFDIAASGARSCASCTPGSTGTGPPGRRNDPARPAAVVIPALNEAASIADVVNRVLALGNADVLVVDDGSHDETARLAAAAGAVVLQAPLRQGAWGAMQTGIRHAMREAIRAW
jgi:hypothetical protein